MGCANSQEKNALEGEVEVMTVFHHESRYGSSSRVHLVWIVIMCMSGVFMTDEIVAEESSSVARQLLEEVVFGAPKRCMLKSVG